MYDFQLGSPQQIAKDEIQFLVAVKRMLPRWLNSIPDSEFVALCELADAAGSRRGKENSVFVETGVGASTLALVWFAAKYGLRLYTWELSDSKSSAIRQVLDEALSFKIGRVSDTWQAVPWSSTSKELGIPVLSEVGATCLLSFHDSDHTWKNLKSEIESVVPLLAEQAVVAVDDANLSWAEVNVGLVNTFRRKLAWPHLDPTFMPDAQLRQQHWELVGDLLRTRFGDVTHVADTYKKNFAKDDYFGWYSMEFEEKVSLGIEVQEDLSHRFDAYVVQDRLS